MDIPRFWAQARSAARTRAGGSFPLLVWGWSSKSIDDARDSAQSRLRRVEARLEAGETPGSYPYGVRPIREEVTQDLEPMGSIPRAVITRNGYGALVLNAAQTMFIDVDMPEAREIARFGAIFGRGRRSKEDEILNRIRAGLGAAPARKFRVYRTAGGFRVLALDREFDPTALESETLMNSVGGDPQYIQLCKVQKSFRARLTPKPWRCGCSTPPSAFPREDAEALSAFATWLEGYEAACAGKATCQFVEEIGTGEVIGTARSIMEFHDRLTRALEPLPLA